MPKAGAKSLNPPLMPMKKPDPKPRKKATAPAKKRAVSQDKAAGGVMPKPLTEAEAEKLRNSFSEKPAAELTQAERLRRIKQFQRLREFERERLLLLAPAEFKDLDQAALWWIAARCADGHFQHRLEGVVIRLIELEALFVGNLGGGFDLINSVIETLLKVANRPPSGGPIEMLEPSVMAQQALASISAKFILSKSISKQSVMPWLAQISEGEHFKKKWEYLRRQTTPHAPYQLEFAFYTMADVDSIMEQLFSKALLYRKDQFPPPRADADAFMTLVKQEAPIFHEFARRILDEIETIQAVSRSALGLPWHNGWVEIRKNRHDWLVEQLKPYVLDCWKNWKAKHPCRYSAVDKRSPGIAWQSLRPCLETVLREFCFPPIKLEAARWFIPKHTPAP